MKKAGWFFAIILLAPFCQAQGARMLEGYYTEEEIRYPAPGEPGDYIMIRKSWYAGDKMRKEEDWLGITIARFDLGKFYILEPRSKTYFEVSAEVLRQYSSAGLKAFGAREDAAGKLYFPEDLFVRTETTKTIGHWLCYQVITNPKYRSPEEPYCVLWYSSEVDFPVQLFGKQLKNLMGDSPEVQGLFDRLTRFEGYPVRSEAHGLSSIATTTLYKMERRTNLDPSLFEVPKDYTLVPMPEGLPEPRWAP